MKRKKYLKILLIIIAAVFAAINALWGLNYLVNVKPYKEKISDTGELMYFEHDDYTFDVSNYQYLSFKFNVSITENRYLNKNRMDVSPVTVDLLVWISPLGEREYGVSIFYNDSQSDDNLADSSDVTKSFDVMIDADGNQLDELSADEQMLFDKCSDKIDKLFDEYNEIWGDI